MDRREIEKHWRLDDPTRDDLTTRPISEVLFPVTHYGHTMSLTGRQYLRLARLALRVVRYRAREGHLPDRLADAVEPEQHGLLEGLFSGQEVKYSLSEHGFTLSDALQWQEHSLSSDYTVSLD